MTAASTVFADASQIIACTTADQQCVLTNAALVVAGGNVLAVGPQEQILEQHAGAARVNCSGCVITPGLIDSHTHAVFGDWRAAEYEQRSLGTPYMEIARLGGGINASVRSLRALSEAELLERSIPRLEELLRFGTTTVEVKSGYGLSTADELKQLRVIRALRQHVPLRIEATFMGAHEYPAEYRDRRPAYVTLIVQEMIPAVAEAGLARFCDVFMEPGVFGAEDTRTILEAGLAHGLLPKLHADELENSGAAELAAEIAAVSADHLGAISPAGIAALARSNTVATLLPATLFFLGRPGFAPARQLIDAGVTLALASDFNPGSSPSGNMPLVMTFACSQMRMSPLEALLAATRGGARALRLDDGRGTLQTGAPADLAVWAVADFRELAYRFGNAPLRHLWIAGRRVHGSL